MSLMEILPVLTIADYLAILLLVLCWGAIGWWIEHPGMRRPSVTVLMAGYQRRWLDIFATREVRIFDSQILANLRQGTAFFASTSLLAIGGVLAMIGNPAPLQGVAEELTARDAPVLLWQLKLMLVALFLTHAFLKFVWSHRLFGYGSVLMAAVPEAGQQPEAPRRARIAAEINVRAFWNFNRGLRSMYFALGALAFLLGPWALVAATAGVVWVLWSREFLSTPHRLLMEEERK